MTDLNTLSHMLKTGVAGPEAQAAAGAEITRLQSALASVRAEICTGPIDDVLWHNKGETTVDFITNTLGDDWTYDKWFEATK